MRSALVEPTLGFHVNGHGKQYNFIITLKRGSTEIFPTACNENGIDVIYYCDV
jgi:hypothetical protein